MKTIRTIIATLSGVLLTFALVAWFSVRRNAAFLQRTIYQGFDQTFVVALVMGCAFLLIAVILTVAIVSTESDEEDEEDEEEPLRRPRSAAERIGQEQPYRRVSRPQSRPQPKGAQADGFARPKTKTGEPSKTRAEQPKPKKKERATESPDEIVIRREDTPVKKAKKPAKPTAELPAAEAPAVLEPAAEAPTVLEPEETVAAPVEETPAPAAEAPAAEEAVTVEEPQAIEEPQAVEEPEPEQEPEPAAEPEPDPEPEESESEPEAIPEEGAEAPETPEETPAEEPAPGREDMVRCVFCGSSVARGAKVCPNCGKMM